MIRVTVELLPGGRGPAQHLGTAIIANDGSGTPTIGNYDATLSRRGQPNSVWKRVRVEGFARKRLLAWDLLAWVLDVATADRPRG